MDRGGKLNLKGGNDSRGLGKKKKKKKSIQAAAAAAGDAASVAAYLKSPTKDPNTQGSFGASALVLAAQNGHDGVMALLLADGKRLVVQCVPAALLEMSRAVVRGANETASSSSSA